MEKTKRGKEVGGLIADDETCLVLDLGPKPRAEDRDVPAY
jgi:hypothetical protein